MRHLGQQLDLISSQNRTFKSHHGKGDLFTIALRTSGVNVGVFWAIYDLLTRHDMHVSPTKCEWPADADHGASYIAVCLCFPNVDPLIF